MTDTRFKNTLQKIQSDIVAINWKGVFKKLTSSQSTSDLNNFLEKLPHNTSNTILIVAGVIWSAAAILGLMTAVQMQKMSQAKMEFEEAQALKPIVPVVTNTAVSEENIRNLAERSKGLYKDLEFKASGSAITVQATTLSAFGQFREALAYVQNGGQDWRITIDNLCIGRECKTRPLSATLRINKVSVKES